MARSNGLEIKERRDRESLVVEIAGELDLGAIPELTGRLADCLAATPEALMLDLSEVTFMDSSGLRMLIELAERARTEGWGLTLVPSRHEPANTVLRMTGADKALPFAPPPPP